MPIRLVSSDGEIFSVRKEVAYQVGAIANMFQALGCDLEDDDDAEEEEKEENFKDDPIPLSNVSGDTLQRIIGWIEYQLAENQAETPKTDKDELPPSDPIQEKPRQLTAWEKEFFNVDKDTLGELIMAANYLDMKDLMDGACISAAAIMSSCKSVADIRKFFNIIDDLSEAEKGRIARENQYVDFNVSLGDDH